MKNKMLILMATAAMLLSLQCKKEAEPCVMSERCFIVPELRPCSPMPSVYYYDQAEKKCKIIVDGLCHGVEIPFETLEDCEASCHCE